MRKITTKLRLMAALVLITSQVYAQGFETYDDGGANKFDWLDRVFTGGNVGAQFGTTTFINVAPLVGFKVTDRFQIGVRGKYQYINSRAFNIRMNVFGYSGFGRYFLTDNLFVHTEYERIMGRFDQSGQRMGIPHLFVGGGYFYPISDNFGMGVMALYELLQRQYSPYINPIINVGFQVGF